MTFLLRGRAGTFALLANQNIRGNIFLGRAPKACYGEAAFVALVTPLDSLKGLQVTLAAPFCFTAGGGREAQIA